MTHERRFYSQIFTFVCLVGAALSVAKTIRVFSLNPREFGTPRGAAEDWLLLVIVLFSVAISAWKTHDIAMIGRAAIVVVSVGLALLFFQDVVETAGGIVPRYIQDRQRIAERNGFVRAVMGIAFLFTGVGILQWRSWGHILCLIISAMLGLGCVSYIVFEGPDWKPLVALTVVASTIVWLRLPNVRYRLKASAGN